MARVNIRESFTATGTSDEKVMRSGSISVAGTFTGTVELQRFMNGAWQTQETYTAAAEAEFDNFAPADMRFECTAYTSGTIDCELLGVR